MATDIRHEVRLLRQELDGAEDIAASNAIVIAELLDALNHISTPYDELAIMDKAQAILSEEGSDSESDSQSESEMGEDVSARLERLFLTRQALPALKCIMTVEQEKTAAYETARRFYSWIVDGRETHDCADVFRADDFLIEFVKRVGCEKVMLDHNPLFVKASSIPAAIAACRHIDFKDRVTRFMQLIQCDNIADVQDALGL